jgi:hypothetical protein
MATFANQLFLESGKPVIAFFLLSARKFDIIEEFFWISMNLLFILNHKKYICAMFSYIYFNIDNLQ